MKQQRFISISLVYLGLAFANAAYAFDMGNMMNPSKWMDNNKDNDRYDDYYDDPGYGYPGPPPGYGYGGAPGYGYGGDPGYGAAPAYGAPGTESKEAEIMRLKERLRQLEGSVR